MLSVKWLGQKWGLLPCNAACAHRHQKTRSVKLIMACVCEPREAVGGLYHNMTKPVMIAVLSALEMDPSGTKFSDYSSG